MKRLNITPELFKEVFAHYARAPRDEQRFDAEDALRLAVGVGEQICPHFAIDTYNETAYTNIARWWETPLWRLKKRTANRAAAAC